MQAARVLDGPAGPRVDAVPGRVGWVGPQAAPPPSGALEPTIRPVRRASTDGAPDRWRVRPWLRDHLRPTAPADRRPGELALIWPGGVPAEAAAVGLRVRLAIVRFPHWVRFDLGHGLVVSTGHPGDDLREARSASTRVEVLMPPDLAPRPGDEVRVLVDRILLDHVAFRTRMAVLFEGFQVVWWERPLAPPLAGP